VRVFRALGDVLFHRDGAIAQLWGLTPLEEKIGKLVGQWFEMMKPIHAERKFTEDRAPQFGAVKATLRTGFRAQPYLWRYTMRSMPADRELRPCGFHHRDNGLEQLAARRLFSNMYNISVCLGARVTRRR